MAAGLSTICYISHPDGLRLRPSVKEDLCSAIIARPLTQGQIPYMYTGISCNVGKNLKVSTDNYVLKIPSWISGIPSLE